MTHALPRVDEGLYEQIITASLDQALRALDPDGTRVVRADLMDGEAHIAIAQHLHGLLVRALRTLPEEGRVAAQLNLANRVVDLLAGHAGRAALVLGRTALVLGSATLVLCRRFARIVGRPQP